MKKKVKDQNGTAIVEFAIILPILFLFVLGIIEFGALLYDKAVITNASREGARAAIVFRSNPNTGTYEPLDDSKIKDVIDNYVSYFRMAFAGSTVNTNVWPDYAARIASSPGDTYRVRVDYTYNFLLLPKFAPGLRNGVNLVAVTEMRRE